MVIGVVTAEYLYDWEWEKFNLAKVDNTIGLGKVEFGVYLNSLNTYRGTTWNYTNGICVHCG